MATLLDLSSAATLFKLDPALESPAQELRAIYASPKLKTWMEGDLLALESTWQIELSPAEQLAALVEIFCSGEVLMFGWQFKPLNHIRDGVWELKTADLRLFGWFHIKDCFVGVAANPTDHIKRYNLYAGHAGEVVRFRDTLDLNEPKFVPGDDPNAVVSNYAFA